MKYPCDCLCGQKHPVHRLDIGVNDVNIINVVKNGVVLICPMWRFGVANELSASLFDAQVREQPGYWGIVNIALDRSKKPRTVGNQPMNRKKVQRGELLRVAVVMDCRPGHDRGKRGEPETATNEPIVMLTLGMGYDIVPLMVNLREARKLVAQVVGVLASHDDEVAEEIRERYFTPPRGNPKKYGNDEGHRSEGEEASDGHDD